MTSMGRTKELVDLIWKHRCNAHGINPCQPCAMVVIERAIASAEDDEREACATHGDAYRQEAIRNAQAMGSSTAARAARQAWEERSIGAARVAQDIRSRGTR